jgi:hypothetical protein
VLPSLPATPITCREMLIQCNVTELQRTFLYKDSSLQTTLLYKDIPHYQFLNMGSKVKLFLCFNWAPRHEGVLEEWRYSSTHSLTSALDAGEWSVSRPSCLTPRERANDTYWIGGWVGPRSGLDTFVKRKIPSPRRKSNPRTPTVQPVD